MKGGEAVLAIFVVVLVVLAIAALIAIELLLAGIMFVLAYVFLFLFRDCIVALWDARTTEELQDVVKVIWTVIPPVIGGVLAFLVPFSVLNHAFPGDKWNWILTVPLPVVFVGSYFYLLKTTTPRSAKWELFTVRGAGQKAETRLAQIEHRLHRDIRATVLTHQVKQWIPSGSENHSGHTRS